MGCTDVARSGEVADAIVEDVATVALEAGVEGSALNAQKRLGVERDVEVEQVVVKQRLFGVGSATEVLAERRVEAAVDGDSLFFQLGTQAVPVAGGVLPVQR
ncbi:MAG: hypothetical protein QM770_20865 [Tepidisphaeraceae bacterium]